MLDVRLKEIEHIVQTIKGLEKIAEFFRARGDMAVGDGKMLLLSWMRAAENAIELLRNLVPKMDEEGDEINGWRIQPKEVTTHDDPVD